MAAYVVTGGSRGIGSALVEGLRGRGEEVIAVGRDEQRLSALEARCGAMALVADLATREGRAQIGAFVREKSLRLSGLIHSAGIVRANLIEQEVTEEVALQISVNLSAAMELTRALIPFFVQGAHVVAISSTLAHRPAPGRAAYAASKAGMEGYIRAAALELGPKGVSVNAISPGVVDTDMIRDAVGGSEDAMSALLSLHKLGRLGMPRDVWQAVEYLLDSDFVTGTVLTVDGGLTLG